MPQKIETLVEKQVMYVCTKYHHSIAVTRTGEVWTWGQNMDGQLGNGNFDNKTAPIRMDALTGIRIIHAACGGSHSLAVSSTVERCIY